ncbi:MAG TPA: class 1 fructose-bisphosphatase [Nitrospinaceae bacterium]|jgi:fructose-1,6-bisphosphatase I|nr:class 1 fructose-bisphosphatase [Nitrospina sp.]HIN88986.1 class 1 fructose-bisphosphatase [Nitrospinaceae bacterium]
MKQTTLVQHLQHQQKLLGATGEFTTLMNEILVAAKIISLEVNKAGIGGDMLGVTGNINVHGEEVQKLDEFANSTFANIVEKSGTVCAITSEEMEEPVIVPEEKAGKYIFMMDPLDGSSNIDVNVSIGTIFSIYQKKSPGIPVTKDDLLQKGTDQIAGGYILYGSSTMFIYSSGNGVHGFTLDPSIGEFFLSHPDMKIPTQGNIYSVNEGNQIIWDDKQVNIVNYFKEFDVTTKRPYKGRYIGSMVSDFHRTLLKGGIFMYPKDNKNPNGKLRFSFEASPLAFIVENAGGRASTGKERILDIVPSDIHQCVPLYIGSCADVKIAESFLKD